MWIIQHSTTPHGVVNSLSQSGTKSIRHVSQPSSFPACHTKQSVSPYAPPYPGSQDFLKPHAAYAPRQIQVGIELDFLKVGGRFDSQTTAFPLAKYGVVVCRNCELAVRFGQPPEFYASSLTLSKQTPIRSCATSMQNLISKIILTSLLTCFRNLVITNGSYRTSLGVYRFWPK
jgi:hypothetical protein